MQAIQVDDMTHRLNFVTETLERIDLDADILQNNLFTDKAIFLLSGEVNRQNMRICGSGNPHHIVEKLCNSPKINQFIWLNI